MKTTKILMMIAAAATMMFASCNKDDSNNTGGGSGISDPNNMAQVGSLTTPLEEVRWDFDDFGTANFNAMYATADVHVHFVGGIEWQSLGKTFDLTSGHAGEDFWFRYEGWAEDGCEITHYNVSDGSLSCYLDNGDRTSIPIFSSGTLTTTRTDEGYTLKIEGTLINGKQVLIKMKVPFTGEVIPLTKNSLIYDGVKYEFTSTSANRNGGSGNVTWSSTGDNGVASSGTTYQGSQNLHIYLYNNPTGDGYRFDFNVTAPGLQLSYQWNNDQLTGTLNGEPFTSTPFTEGDAEISAYYNQLRVTVIGTLSNGKVLKLYVDNPY